MKTKLVPIVGTTFITIYVALVFTACKPSSSAQTGAKEQTSSPPPTNTQVAVAAKPQSPQSPTDTNAGTPTAPQPPVASLPAQNIMADTTVPANVTTCPPPITPIKNAGGNYGAIYFGQYRVELQGYFISNSQGVPYQAALGQVPTQDFLISSGEVAEVSSTNIVLRIGNSTVSFSVPKEALICRVDKPWNINDIKPGYVITILSKGADNRAISVRGNPMGFTLDQHLGMYGCGSY